MNLRQHAGTARGTVLLTLAAIAGACAVAVALLTATTTAPVKAQGETTQLMLFHQAGEPLFQGFGPVSTFNATSYDFTASRSADGRSITVMMRGGDGDETFDFVFGSTIGDTIGVGSYPNARELAAADSDTPTLHVVRDAAGASPDTCTTSFGIFEVLELEASGTDVIRFAADFQFGCDDSVAPWSLGSIRFNADTPPPNIAAPERTISGRITGPTELPVSNADVCLGRPGQDLDTVLQGNCVKTTVAGVYEITATDPFGGDLGDHYVFVFPTGNTSLQYQCWDANGGCSLADFINLATPVAVGSFIDLQLDWGCFEVAATIVGTEGPDTLTGTESADVIVGLGGDDVISGLGGDDTICPGNGDNTVFGGDGNDRLLGGVDDDLMRGQAGNDVLWGNFGDDVLRGGDGDDQVRGANGNDDVHGGRDNDGVYGDSGDDVVRGGTGDDYVDGGEGVDEVNGNGGGDVVRGGPGNDIKVHGGPRPDIVHGDDGDDVNVKGLGGADQVFGGDGNDQLFGSAQNDVIDGGAGTDDCNGGTGDFDSSVNCEFTSAVETVG